MKTFIAIAILFFIGFSDGMYAQARMTPALKERLSGKTDFYEIKSAVRNYFSEERARLSPTDSLGKRFLNRQFKFWNRWLYDAESKLEPDGTVANWTKRMYEAEMQENFHDQSNDRASNSSWSLVGPVTVDDEDGIGRVL